VQEENAGRAKWTPLRSKLFTFVLLSPWFDRLTTIGFFPNVLSEVEGQAQGERFLLN